MTATVTRGMALLNVNVSQQGCEWLLACRGAGRQYAIYYHLLFILLTATPSPIISAMQIFPLWGLSRKDAQRPASQRPHFTDEKPEAWRGGITSPRSHSWGRLDTRLKSFVSLNPDSTICWVSTLLPPLIVALNCNGSIIWINLHSSPVNACIIPSLKVEKLRH